MAFARIQPLGFGEDAANKRMAAIAQAIYNSAGKSMKKSVAISDILPQKPKPKRFRPSPKELMEKIKTAFLG